MKNRIKKLLLIAFAIADCFALFLAPRAQADWFDLSGIAGDVVGTAMDQAFDKMGVDQSELRYTIQTANVSRRKKQQPQVEISLNPENPVSGKKVSAVATPTYFLNTAENLYFTWYLKPDGCPDEKNTSPSGTQKEKCDFDGNGEIDINDYKVKAARILAGDGFEWAEANYNSGGGKEYKAIWGGDDQKEKGTKTGDHCFIHDVDTGDEYEISCNKHLFAEAPGHDFEAGDDSYGSGEEEFFRTDPKDPDTADTGNGDEANVVGLGMNTFSWNYQEGDEIGVVIEGISIEPTQESDSSFKIMWALVNNKCSLGDTDIEDYPDTSTSKSVSVGTGSTCPDGSSATVQTTTTTEKTMISQVANIATIRTTTHKTDIEDSNCDGNYEETAGAAYAQTTTCPNGPNYLGQYNGITCTGFDDIVNLDEQGVSLSEIKKASDINSCLYGNFFDPSEGGGAKEKMDISLSYTPEFPMNDPDNKNGDELSVQSSITNAQSEDYLKYTWELFESDAPNPDSWDRIVKSRLPENIQLSGLNLNSLKLRLNIPNLKKYLRVKLTLSEGISASSTLRKGYAEIIIPVSNITQRIKAYGTSVSSDLSLSPKSKELCVTNGEIDAICYVSKNELVALSINKSDFTDFIWTADGKALVPIGSSEVGSTAYLPILEENGHRYTVEVSATNSKGEKINLVRTFEVADPEVKIISGDTSVCNANLLGYYIDLDGKYWPDYSQTNFSALSETPIKLKAEFYGISPAASDYSWYVDGYEINTSNASSYGYSISSDGTITLSEKAISESYSVGVGLVYTQDKNTKRALSKYWGVPINEFYEKKIGTNVQISFVGSISDIQSAGKNTPKKIMASMYSAAPEYIILLIRMVLTAFFMLVFSKVLLSFFPNLNKNEY